MKNSARPLIILLLVLFAQNITAHKYYFKQDRWYIDGNLRLKSITFQFDGVTIKLREDESFKTHISSSRITRVTRSMEFERVDKTIINDPPYTYEWPSDDLTINVGSAPVYPLVCWDPQITITSDMQSIYTDEQVQLTINRNGYTGSLDIYAGNNSMFNDRSFKLLTFSGSATTHSFIPETDWDSFSQLLGGDLNAFRQNFYLRYNATCSVLNSSLDLNPNPVGPFRLKPVLETSLPPGGPNNICKDVQLSPMHLPPPYKVTVKQAAVSKTIFDNLMEPGVSLDFSTLNNLTGFSKNLPTEITFASQWYSSLVTRMLVVTFLEPAPDTTGIEVDISNQSCEEVEDGAISINLPKKSSDYKLKVNIAGVKNVVTEFDTVKIPLYHGDYLINLEYQSDDNLVGCIVDLGEYSVPLTEKLTIERIEETHKQSCYYRDDVELTVHTKGGVQEGPFTYYNIGFSTSTDKVFRNLSGNTTYSFKVADTRGCISNIKTFTTHKAESLRISIDDQTQLKCAGEKGTIKAAGTGGSGPYVFSMNGGAYKSSGIFSGLPGTIQHTLKLQDSELCTTKITFNLPEPPKLEFTDPAYELSNFNGYNIRCRDDLNGELKVYSTGGTGNTQYILDGEVSLVQDSSRFVFLGAGSYQVSLKDENGCSSDTIRNITLTRPEGIKFNNPEITRESCHETKDGSVITNFLGEQSSMQWYDSDNLLLPGKTTKNLDNVGSGSYRLSVKYNMDECSAISPLYIIPETPSLEFFTIRNESCADGIGGGVINITRASNGSPPYSCVFNDGLPKEIVNFPTAFENLNTGSYQIELRDGNYARGGIYSEKCKADQTIFIYPKNPVSVSHTISEPLCNGDENGSIVTQVSGTDRPFVHIWFNSFNDSIYSGNILEHIPTGEYVPLIADSFNCRSLQPSVKVNEPDPILFKDIITEKTSCFEVNDGTIHFGSQGGSGFHTYSLNSGSIWNPAPFRTGLGYGNHSLLARDINECIADTVFTIEAFNPDIQLLSFDSISCQGESDGKLSFKAVNGKTASYSYNLIKSGQSFVNATGQFFNLGKSEYHAFANDANGCFTDTFLYNMSEPEPLEVRLSLLDSSSCGQSTGKISFDISGGNGGNMLIWSNSAIGDVTNLNINALNAGLYNLNVKDRKLCSQASFIVVPDRPAPVITGIDIIDSTWCNLPLGSVKVNVTGGSPGYKYRWDNPLEDSTAIAGNLKAGLYNVVVTDRYNCSDNESILLNDGPELEITSLIEDAHCGQKDGRAVLSVTGGVSPFTFKWPDSISAVPLTTNIMSHLGSGSYNINVADKAGCLKNFIIDLDDLEGPEIIRVNSSKSWCGLAHGTANVLAEGGSPPYTYQWTKSGSDILLGSDDNINSLKSGNYIIRVTDSENCRISETIGISDSLELEPSLLLATLDSSACNKPTGSLGVSMQNGLEPYNYRWNTGYTGSTLNGVTKGIYKVRAIDKRGCRDSLELQLEDKHKPVLALVSGEKAYCYKPTGSIIVSASLGNAPYKAFLESNPESDVLLSFYPAINRYSGSIDSLMPSATPYKVKISDANGCESNEISAVVLNHDPMTIHLADMSPVSCFGLSDGRAKVIVENGYEPYYYNWNKSPVNSNINSSLPPGPFSVTVTDIKGCTKTLLITETPITQPTPLTVDKEYIIHPSCFDHCDGSITLFAKGGNGEYSYFRNNEDRSQTFNNLCAGNHSVKISDKKNCTYEKDYTLVNPAPLTETELPDFVKICSGQLYMADPGIEWNNISWTSSIDFESTDHIAQLSRGGEYYLAGYSSAGCLVMDTLRIEVSDDLLDAEFLMMSQAHAGDTVVIIEVSWPIAEKYSWEFPESVRLINDNPYYKELVFEEPGNFYIQLTATLAGCSSMSGKYIEILDIVSEPVTELPRQSHLIKSFVIYPNPVVADLNIGVELSEEKDVRLEIISTGTGNSNRILYGYSLSKYALQVNVGELQRGTYLIRLIAGDEIKTKLLVVR